jgi:hypothetical protein
MKPLACPMSTGLINRKVVSYRTLPSGSLPSSKSVMIALCGSPGSSSPNARPRTCSYARSCPVSAVVESIVILVTRACAALATSAIAIAKLVPRAT